MNQLSETLTHIKTLSGGEEEGGGGFQSGGGRRQAPGQQMEECVWRRDQR